MKRSVHGIRVPIGPQQAGVGGVADPPYPLRPLLAPSRPLPTHPAVARCHVTAQRAPVGACRGSAAAAPWLQTSRSRSADVRCVALTQRRSAPSCARSAQARWTHVTPLPV
jgi:hypothetical protein